MKYFNQTRRLIARVYITPAQQSDTPTSAVPFYSPGSTAKQVRAFNNRQRKLGHLTRVQWCKGV